MKPNAWGRRFLESTRGRIVTLVGQAERTASELAQALGLTTNAVRAHLAALERDGLVRPQGVRRGAFRPTATYALTPEAEHFLPRPYKPLLQAVLDTLSERLPPETVDQIVRAAGGHMAANHQPARPGSGLRERAAQALAVLSEFGGQAEVVDVDGGKVIRSTDGCPLADLVAAHPEVCRLVEAVLTGVAGVPVREKCRRADVPRCAFEVARG